MPSNYQPKYQMDSEVTELVFTGEARRTVIPSLPLSYGFPIGKVGQDEGHTKGIDTIRHFADVLEALGMRVSIREITTEGGAEFVTMSIDHPSIEDARAIRSRNAGRKPSQTAKGSPLDGMTPQERLDWLYTHTPEEGCAALGGVSTRTRKRRIAELRKECQS